MTRKDKIMKKIARNTFLVGLIVLSIGIVKATEIYYQTTVTVGYPYKLVGQYRNFGAGEQKIELNKINLGTAERQEIEIEYQQKTLVGSTKLGKERLEIVYSEPMNFSKTFQFGNQKKSGKRRYIFYNNLSGQNNTAIFIDDVKMYPRA